jgi:RNA polymerase sigma-70 factor (ECF subfamily)
VTAYLSARGAREPEDLTSEVFLGVFRQIRRFEGGAAEFRTFVFSVAHRRLVDELRQRARRPQTVCHDDAGDERSTISAEETALARISDERVRKLLDLLAGDQRAVLLLRVTADLTCEQVATVLGKSTGAVKQLQRRALAALRDSVEREGVPL